jgi:isoquinoline 1-oxidoreductase subunit alpha
MASISFQVNGRPASVEVDPETPLLWVLRETLGLRGTKFGCGEGVCGSCTVLEGEVAVRSCQIPVSAAAGKRYTTIEGLSAEGSHPCQRAWLEEDVAQCGYCQPGMILEAAALLTAKPHPEERDIQSAFADHICRCGTYPRIARAVQLAARMGGAK